MVLVLTRLMNPTTSWPVLLLVKTTLSPGRQERGVAVGVGVAVVSRRVVFETSPTATVQRVPTG